MASSCGGLPATLTLSYSSDTRTAYFKSMVNAPWFTRNSEVHKYLEMPLIKDEIRAANIAYKKRLHLHVNPLAVKLIDGSADVKRLKRARILELEHRQ